jgi:hypothetical protein
MKEQQVNDLIAMMARDVTARAEQTAAILRLAESNEALVATIMETLSDGEPDETDTPAPPYLSARR